MGRSVWGAYAELLYLLNALDYSFTEWYCTRFVGNSWIRLLGTLEAVSLRISASVCVLCSIYPIWYLVHN